MLGWLAVAVAVMVAAPSLLNGFAYDDLPLVVENARITTLLPPWEYFTQSYWPAGGLYRPLTVSILALQWKLGGGAPWIFHATNMALHALVTGLVFLLARRLMAPAWAATAAILFAVHPVHVEAVANVVGISELLCSAFVLGAVLLACMVRAMASRRRHPPGRDRLRHARGRQQGAGLRHAGPPAGRGRYWLSALARGPAADRPSPSPCGCCWSRCSFSALRCSAGWPETSRPLHSGDSGPPRACWWHLERCRTGHGSSGGRRG